MAAAFALTSASVRAFWRAPPAASLAFFCLGEAGFLFDDQSLLPPRDFNFGCPALTPASALSLVISSALALTRKSVQFPSQALIAKAWGLPSRVRLLRSGALFSVASQSRTESAPSRLSVTSAISKQGILGFSKPRQQHSAKRLPADKAFSVYGSKTHAESSQTPKTATTPRRIHELIMIPRETIRFKKLVLIYPVFALQRAQIDKSTFTDETAEHVQLFIHGPPPTLPLRRAPWPWMPNFECRRACTHLLLSPRRGYQRDRGGC